MRAHFKSAEKNDLLVFTLSAIATAAIIAFPYLGDGLITFFYGQAEEGSSHLASGSAVTSAMHLYHWIAGIFILGLSVSVLIRKLRWLLRTLCICAVVLVVSMYSWLTFNVLSQKHISVGFSLAVFRGDLTIASRLVAIGADVNSIYSGSNMNPLGHRPLHVAVRQKDVQMIQFLVEHGADASMPNKKGETAIELADKSGDQNLIKALKK